MVERINLARGTLCLRGKRVGRFLLLLCFFPVFIALADYSKSESKLWNGLREGGHFALLRHAIAPGTGDPAWFELGKCSTQRNLSEEGREQAREIGRRFRANGIHRARVFSSQWCRCIETAELLGLGPVQKLSALNSFFRVFERRQPQTQALKSWLNEQNFDQPFVLVTHQVNITALTSIYPRSGELVIVHRSPAGELTVAGTIEPD